MSFHFEDNDEGTVDSEKINLNDSDDFDSVESDDDSSSGTFECNNDLSELRTEINFKNDQMVHDDQIFLKDRGFLHGDNLESNGKRRPQWRRALIVTLTVLLALLFVCLMFQIRELYITKTSSKSSITLPITNNDFLFSQKHERNNQIIDGKGGHTAKAGEKDKHRIPSILNRIYTHSSLSSKNYRAGGVLSDDMLHQYEQDGVIVIRNLISPKLLDRLDMASKILIREENAKRNKRRQGKQFHMVKNGAIFLGVPNPNASFTCLPNHGEELHHCSATSSDTLSDNKVNNMIEESNRTSILSSFRDLAMYSKIPRVAASLLRLDSLRVGGDENLRPDSIRSRRRSKRRSEREKGDIVQEESETNDDDDYEIDHSINLRICRDIFLTKDNDPYACGWHVDDTGFWPSIADDPGVNAWITLDDMPWPWSSSHQDTVVNDAFQASANADKQNEVSLNHDVNINHPPVATFALSLGSHRASWRHEAYYITGSTHTLPPEGYKSAADLIERRTGSGTCNIQTSAPDLYEKLEERKVVYDLKKGDVIFHTRWLFHRTVTVDEYSKMVMSGANTHSQRNISDNLNSKIFRRYSIRYSPGTARVPPGYGVELSVLHNPLNANRTLNEIVESDGPWYPKVWPHVVKHKSTISSVDESCVDCVSYEEEIKGITNLVYDKIPKAEIIQKERKREIQSLLSARGR